MMARRPSKFRQQDVTKALRAAQAAGIDVQRYEIDKDGKIIVVAGRPETGEDKEERSEWDHL